MSSPPRSRARRAVTSLTPSPGFSRMAGRGVSAPPAPPREAPPPPIVPPCGHIAGLYARSDARAGIFKAPANEEVRGALDLGVLVGQAGGVAVPADGVVPDQEALNPEGVNCLRTFPGRGIRVWGARTLSADPAWRYVGVRRLFLTAARWIARTAADLAFEPADPRLWARIERELGAYFDELFHRGA